MGGIFNTMHDAIENKSINVHPIIHVTGYRTHNHVPYLVCV